MVKVVTVSVAAYPFVGTKTASNAVRSDDS
jgi:hypothetical protein